jgi:hypothetical protein
VILFGSFATCVEAGVIDPQVQVREAGESGAGGPGTVTILTDNFTIITPTGDSPTDGTSCIVDGTMDQSCDLINGSGQTWTTLTLDIDPGEPFDSCSVLDFFSGCPIQQGGSGIDSIYYFSGGTGIPDGQAFGFSFSGWEADTEFTGSADTPEPASSALMLFFCMLLAVRSRWRR